MVADVLRGPSAGLGYYDSLLCTLDGRTLLFTAQNYIGIFSLWRTDGSSKNTKMIDPWPGRDGPVSIGVTVHGSFYFSFGWQDPLGMELWRTQGQKGTTGIVVDLYPGHDGSVPTNLTLFKNNLLAFSARTPASGFELFTTNGTAEGTRLVKDIVPGKNDSSPAELFSFQNFVLFSAKDSEHGRELWISDGTENRTTIVADLLPGQLSSNPFGFIKVGDTVYFIARGPGVERQLWKLEITNTLLRHSNW
jgi:trimeric autotransporter adhesin